jgi:hypothetical protein
MGYSLPTGSESMEDTSLVPQQHFNWHLGQAISHKCHLHTHTEVVIEFEHRRITQHDATHLGIRCHLPNLSLFCQVFLTPDVMGLYLC